MYNYVYFLNDVKLKRMTSDTKTEQKPYLMLRLPECYQRHAFPKTFHDGSTKVVGPQLVQNS